MHDWPNMTDAEVVDAYHLLSEESRELRADLGHGRQEIFDRVKYNGGTALHSDLRVAKVKDGTPEYDLNTLAPLLEILPTYEIEKAYTKPVVRMVEDPAKWHGTQLNRIAREWGDKVAARIEQARIPTDQKVVIEEVKRSDIRRQQAAAQQAAAAAQQVAAPSADGLPF